MRPWQVSLAVLLLVTGFFAVVQWRTGRPFRAQVGLPSQRVEQLAVLLRRQEETRAALEAEIQQLAQRVRAYERAIAQGQGAAETMAEELDQLRMILGLTAVEGPGVAVRLQAADIPGTVFSVPLRAADLAGLINELWSAGAEAVAVNGTRILATTGMRDQEDVIVVGAVAMRPPFVIAAIGEPLTLQTALRLRGGFVEGLRSIGLQVTVQGRPRLRLEAYRGPRQFRHARPLRTP